MRQNFAQIDKHLFLIVTSHVIDSSAESFAKCMAADVFHRELVFLLDVL